MVKKLKRKYRSIFLLIIINLIVFSVGLLQYKPTLSNSIPENEHQDSQNLNTSGYWNLTNSYIYIDDAGLNGITWAEAELEPWLSGSGTWGDPYIIENVINYDTGMMGAGVVASISIMYSDKPFIIRNCTLLNSSFGIELYAVKHGTLINNTLSGNIQGIRPVNSENITIRDNTINDNGYGIYSPGANNLYDIINNTMFYNYVGGISLVSPSNINITENIIIGIGDYIDVMAGGIRIYGGWNLIIKNNKITNSSDEGIVFSGGNNNKNQILNNIIKGSKTQGIYTISSRNQIIWNNTIIDSIDSGIQIVKSTYGDNNNITDNSIIGSGSNGIYTQGSSNNNITNNSIIRSGSNGIYIQGGSNNTISNNNVSDSNLDGLYLLDSHNNNISNSIFSNNTKSGTYIQSSYLNQLWENRFINNDLYGVRIWGSASINNILYLNKFIGNTLNTYDDGSSITDLNYWNNSNAGNFWDDYSGEDYNDDEIGDTPYEINTPYTVPIVMDYLPIWDDGPAIIVKSPQDYDVYLDPPSFVVECFDPGLDMMWYTVNYSTIKHFIFDNGSIDFNIWKDLSEGNISLRFYGNDTDGNIYFKEITVVKDNSSPIIMLNSPFNGSLFGINAPTFNISITDPALNLKWYTLNDGNLTHIFSSSTGAISQSAWESVPEGNVKITFYANDLVGLSSFEVLTLTKDISPPQITIISPEDGDFCNETAPYFTVKVEDLNLASMWYTIDNGIHNIPFSTNFTINQTSWETVWNAASHNDEIIIRIYASDLVANLRFEEVSLIKFAPNEDNNNDGSPTNNAIVGYELTVFFSAILGMSLILIKKLKSNRKSTTVYK